MELCGFEQGPRVRKNRSEHLMNKHDSGKRNWLPGATWVGDSLKLSELGWCWRDQRLS